MSIGLRLKQLREENNLDKKEFSSTIKVDASQYGKIENDKLKPTVSQLMEISSVYNVSIDWICTGVDTSLNKLKDVKVVIESNKHGDQMPAVVTVDSQQKDNVVLVPVKAAAGYLNGYGDPKFIESLPSYRLPNIQNGSFRMFQVAGHSMFPTLHTGSYVVGQWVENWQRDIKDDRVYVVISHSPESEGGVVVKRLLNRIKKYNNIYCKSDNRRDYPSYNVQVSDIVEIWEVKMAMVFELSNPASLYDRMNDIEAELMQLKSSIKN